MPTQRYDITEDVVSYLGIPASSNPLYYNTKFNYDYAFNGIPFLASTSEARPYRRQLVDIRKQQVDQSNDPGEQSLSGWWLRSQSSFTGGSGIRFLEPTSDDNVMRSYDSSFGLDVWTEGQVTMLNAMATPISLTGNYMCVCIDSVGNERIVTASGTTIIVRDTAGAQQGSSITIGFTGTILGVRSVGTGFVFWTSTTSGGVYYASISGTTFSVTKIYNPSNPGSNAHTVNNVWYVKGRLIVAQTDTNNLKNLTEAAIKTTGTSNLSSTHFAETSDTAWTWADVAETPTGFLAAGYSGNYSAVYQIGLSIDGSIVNLTSPRITAEMPLGETIRCIRGYLGTYVGIGTNLGFRVGTIDSNGFLSYGPLINSTANAVTNVVAYDRFLWFGAKASVNGSTGTYRVDLSNPDGSGFFPYAGDIIASNNSTTSTSDIIGMATLSTGKMVMTTGDNYLWIEGTNKVASGVLKTGLIRFSTVEPKVFKRIRVRGIMPTGCSITISSVLQSGNETSIISATSTSLDQDFQVSPTNSLDCLGFKFEFVSSGSSGPTMYGYQVKALPAVTKSENIQISLLCFDYETDKHGTRYGVEKSSKTRYQLLVDAVRNGDTITMQDLNTGEQFVVVVDGLDFTQTAPPRPGMSGFGGMVTLVVRTIV